MIGRLLCLVGWHAYSVRVTSGLQRLNDGSGKYAVVQRLIAECDRKGCAKSKAAS